MGPLLLIAPIAAAVAGTERPAPTNFSSLPASAAQRGPENAGKPHPVLARLVADSVALPAGGTARLGVHLTQDDGWHTYWKSPGDIGLPTNIAWTAPSGVTVSPHRYPVPERFEQDGMTSWGYSHEVLLVSDVTVPAGTPPGKHTVAADVDWLVCLTTCIPGKAHLELPIDVVAGPAAPSPFRPLFDAYEARMPVASTDAFTWTVAVDPPAVPAKGQFKAVFELTPTGAPLDGAKFAPMVPASYEWGVSKLDVKSAGGKVVVTIDADTYDPDPLPTDASIGGLAIVDVGGKQVATELAAPLRFAPKDGSAAVAPVAPPTDTPTPSNSTPPKLEPPKRAAGGMASLLGAMLFAVVGGLVLNVMPCVLPVLTLKLYGLVEQTDITSSQRRAAGLAYSAGVIASFVAMALAIVILRTAFGMEVDWGFQFQYPPYVAALATVVFAFGLSLLGVFEIPALGADAADRASSRDGLLGTFLTGVFATLLATPCSAPFLGSAIAYAFGAPTVELLAIFVAVGFGLALPFLLVAFVPALFRFLPRPGTWMDTFKQLLGFTLLATTVWLVDVLVAQIGADRAIGFLAFLVSVALGAWVFGRWGGVAESGRRQLVAASAALAIAVVGGFSFLDLQLASAATCDTGEVKRELAWDDGVPWQPFTDQRLAALDGHVVFADFTADWCLTCKVNEHTILETEAVTGTMKELGVVPLKADWTRRDENITAWLRKHGRAGVPMYLVIPADRSREPILLPEVITPGMVNDALREAARTGA